MLSYCRGDDLSKLADHLLDVFKQNPPSNPLAQEIFVVQNHGMARWLSLYLAEERGVAANLKFEFPAERIWALIRVLEPDVPETLPSDRGPMAWSILQILRDDEDPNLEVLRQYAKEDDPVRQEMRQWKLAGRIADVFDQYLTYRPDMMISWQKGSHKPQSASEQWQAVLWKKLTAQWEQLSITGYPHRALLQQKVTEAIDNNEIELQDLPQRVTVFGVSAMPPIYLETSVKLSKLIDVNFYALTPGRETPSPIHESLGKTGQEYLNLLERYINENDINPQREVLNRNPVIKEHSLLHNFQAELMGVETGQDQAAWDASIQVHSCHSARREVEVLYDQLIALFDEDETLNPSDVLVLAPDLETYAPEIEAIFGTVEEGLPEIPFHLSDRFSGQSNPVDNAMVKLLELAESRFKVTDVLDLLDSDPVQKNFEFSEDNLKTLEQWIEDTHIRWGIDEDSKAALDLPRSNNFTWKSGLDRMVLGYAMKQENDRLFNGIYPYKAVEQSEDALLAGRFSNLTESLFEFHRETKTSHSLEEWAKLINKWLGRFLPEKECFTSLQRLRDLVADLANQQEISGFSDEVPFRIIRSYLQKELEQNKKGGGRNGRGVTFGSLVQMRNIPAKVIYMLGMNDGSFPRSKIPIAFDLMNRDQKPGDRSHSNEDRQLFLETLLVAKERIYFSYIGQSNRQDTTFPPSVILRELIDYLTEQYGIEEKEILTEHPLQAFSTKYFKEGSNKGLFSYSTKHKVIAENLQMQEPEVTAFLDAPLPDPDSEFQKLTIGELIRFFQHPARYLLQNRFGIYLNRDRILDEDREPFLLEGLIGYQLGQELLKRFLNNRSLEQYKQVARATDMLPEGWPGEQFFSQKKSDVHDFGSNLQNILQQEKLGMFEVDLEIGNFRITGKLDQVYSGEQVFYRFGRMRPKDMIELWVKHLAFQEVKPESHSGISRLYTKGKNEKVEFYQLSPISVSRDILDDLLLIYWSGLKENTYFFPESSFTFAQEVCFRNDETEQGIKAAASRWKSDYSPYPREGDDAYNKLLMSGDNPLYNNRFQETAILFWEPFFDLLNKEGE